MARINAIYRLVRNINVNICIYPVNNGVLIDENVQNSG